MTFPTRGRRVVLRTIVTGAVAGLLVAGLGFLAERSRFGSDLTDARAKVETDVRAQFEALASRLAVAVQEIASDQAALPAAIAGDTDAIRTLFDAIGRAERAATLREMALTVYAEDGRPLAWTGRAASLPAGRLTGPSALFLVPSSIGLRLVRIEPVSAPATPPGGVIVVETSLPTVNSGTVADGLMLDTSVVPVRIRPRYEGVPDLSAGLIVVRAPGGDVLAAAEVPDETVAAARSAFRSRVAGTLLAVGAVTLLLLIGPLLDWRRLVARPRLHTLLTLSVLALLVGARAVLWAAVRWADLAHPSLVPASAGSDLSWLLLASPLDFVLTAFLASAVVAVFTSTYEQWRQGRWLPTQLLSDAGAGRLAMFAVTQVLAGATAGMLLIGHEAFLGRQLSQAPMDLVHFALTPWNADRIAVDVGLVLLHAAVLWLAVLVLRAGVAPWIIPVSDRLRRLGVLLLWLLGGLSVAAIAQPWGEPAPLVPAALAIGFAAATAFTIGRYRTWLRHASQALRLVALFVALAVPSLVFYPSLVEAAGRGRRQLIELRYASEVMNQRRNLQLYLAQAQQQMDRLTSLPELIEAVEPASANGPPPTDAAFAVWSQTELAAQRLTSSVELYDASGMLISRFALKLPETSGAQEGNCSWELFEEVSPFFAEERRLLHADRGICVTGPDGRVRKVGSLVVHVMLDYSNLSFVSAQSPYVALLRSPSARPLEAAPGQLEFAVYGWSRRPLYNSGRDVWPLEQPLFERLQASRDPFWSPVRRGDARYDIYFLNDRFGIYALGYPQVSGFDHLVTLAELVVLAGLTFVILLAGGALYGRVTARTPVSGRALLREVRVSFYRKLFLAFVLAAVVPVLALAFVTRAYIASLMRADIETEAARTASSASRVVEDFGSLQTRGGATAIDDNLVVWLSRVIAQDVNIFDSSSLLASSERNLFASGLLPTRTPGDVYRSIVLDARASYLGRESVGGPEYLVAAAPVRFRGRQAILTVPLTLRQQEIQTQIDELDRRVLLATLLFILLGAGIGYSMAERIADPVNRLTRATQLIARGDLEARVLATSADELSRLVEAFNRMAADLQRQRGELERTNRLAAWADMARQVAHDIKNPLTPIQLNAEHLRRVHVDHGQPLGRIVDDCVTNILTQVRLLRQLAGEFSSFASSPTPRPTPTDVGEVLEEVLEPYRTGLAGRVSIETQVTPGLPTALVDRTLLGRALTNIIENALHAMPGGGRLAAAVRSDGPLHLELAVTDTGVGMDADSLKRIFEPYFSTKASGTGLGLTIAKRNVELNGGTIAVSSKKNVGTTVQLRVPITPIR